MKPRSSENSVDRSVHPLRREALDPLERVHGVLERS